MQIPVPERWRGASRRREPRLDRRQPALRDGRWGSPSRIGRLHRAGARDDPADQGPNTAGTISEVNSRSVRAPAPATLKLVVVTTTTTPCSGKTYTLFPPVPYIPYVGMRRPPT